MFWGTERVVTCRSDTMWSELKASYPNEWYCRTNMRTTCLWPDFRQPLLVIQGIVPLDSPNSGSPARCIAIRVTRPSKWIYHPGRMVATIVRNWSPYHRSRNNALQRHYAISGRFPDIGGPRWGSFASKGCTTPVHNG